MGQRNEIHSLDMVPGLEEIDICTNNFNTSEPCEHYKLRKQIESLFQIKISSKALL